MENKELRNEVESLVEEVTKTHRYSMSRIYGAYNQVFGKNEKPQSCASCLIRKMQELTLWLAQQPQETSKPIANKRATTKRANK